MNTPSIAELVRAHATKVSDSLELYHLILQHHPQASIETVIAELKRLAEADLTAAYRIEHYVAHRE